MPSSALRTQPRPTLFPYTTLFRSESMQKKTEVLLCVAALIRKGDRILLNRRRNNRGAGSWAPIVGHMQFGESPEECAIREAREEAADRKSTRLNSSHRCISYAVFCFTHTTTTYTLSLHDALPI